MAHRGARLGMRLTLMWRSIYTPMAMLKKVKAGIRTSLEISSIQEIPELKKYLMMTLIEMMMSWNPRKVHAKMALMKWILFKKRFTLPASSRTKPWKPMGSAYGKTHYVGVDCFRDLLKSQCAQRWSFNVGTRGLVFVCTDNRFALRNNVSHNQHVLSTFI